MTCPALPRDALAARLSPTQAALLRLVLAAPGLSGDELAARLYAGRPDGGPEDARGVVRVSICKANRRLAGSGWRISGWARGHGYRVVPEEVRA